MSFPPCHVVSPAQASNHASKDCGMTGLIRANVRKRHTLLTPIFIFRLTLPQTVSLARFCLRMHTSGHKSRQWMAHTVLSSVGGPHYSAECIVVCSCCLLLKIIWDDNVHQ